MLPVPVAPGATQRSHHALSVEELDFFDVDALMTNDDAQVHQEDIKDIVHLEELLSSKEAQNGLFEEVDASVFESMKMWSLSQADPNNTSIPLIPLSVQQAQLDSIDPQLISNSDWIQDNFPLSPVLVCRDDGTTSQSAAAEASMSQLPATQGSTADQTVPFRRHDSTCSMMSCSSEVKSERCSVSDTETAMLSFLSTAPPPAGFSSRRGRPSSAGVSPRAIY